MAERKRERPEAAGKTSSIWVNPETVSIVDGIVKTRGISRAKLFRDMLDRELSGKNLFGIVNSEFFPAKPEPGRSVVLHPLPETSAAYKWIQERASSVFISDTISMGRYLNMEKIEYWQKFLKDGRNSLQILLQGNVGDIVSDKANAQKVADTLLESGFGDRLEVQVPELKTDYLPITLIAANEMEAIFEQRIDGMGPNTYLESSIINCTDSRFRQIAKHINMFWKSSKPYNPAAPLSSKQLCSKFTTGYPMFKASQHRGLSRFTPRDFSQTSCSCDRPFNYMPRSLSIVKCLGFQKTPVLRDRIRMNTNC